MKFRSSQAPERNSQEWRILLGIGCVIFVLIVVWLFTRRNRLSADAQNVLSSKRIAPSRNGGTSVVSMTGRSGIASSSPEGIVAAKLKQFSHLRHALVERMADHFKSSVPEDVARFFAAAEAGNWEELVKLFERLEKRHNAEPRSEELDLMWRPILETWGIASESRDWPAQKLLDYSDRLLGSLRPGMVYIGGTDPGAFFTTFMNETSEGEHHVIFTQNALADNTYLDYLQFVYGDRMNTVTKDESKQAFNEYVSDLEKRIAHDKQFPDEPEQVQAGENYKLVDGKPDVSGSTAVMAINERLLQRLLEKNPDLAFALEESFPLKTTYGAAAPLGPITELRASGTDNALTPERASATTDYWTDMSRQLLDDPEAAENHNTRVIYAKMASAHANLLKDRNFVAEAEQTYRTAVQICPDSAEAVYGLANLLYNKGQKAEGLALIDEFQRRKQQTGEDPIRPQ